MKDFHGHTVEAQPASWRPRSGQWILFNLTDTDKQKELVKLGAHAARDGSLVAIYSAQHVGSVIEVKKSDGNLERSGGEVVPGRLIVVDSNGNNFSQGVRDKDSGHVEVQDIFFFPDSPGIESMRSLEDMADMPPGRVVHPDWKPKS